MYTRHNRDVVIEEIILNHVIDPSKPDGVEQIDPDTGDRKIAISDIAWDSYPDVAAPKLHKIEQPDSRALSAHEQSGDRSRTALRHGGSSRSRRRVHRGQFVRWGRPQVRWGQVVCGRR